MRALLRAHARLRPLLAAETYDALFADLDVDGDGMVDEDEFRHFCREARRPAGTEAALAEVLATASDEAIVRVLFCYLEDDVLNDEDYAGDEAAEDVITRESLSRAIRRSKEVRSILRVHEFLRPLLDEANHAEAFERIDANNDGVMQWEEFAAWCAAAATRGAAAAAAAGAGDAEAAAEAEEDAGGMAADWASRPPPAASEDALREALSTADEDRLVQLLFVYLDADGSGTISAAEVLKAIEGSHAVRNILKSQAFLRPLLDPATTAATFARIDRDGNGSLDYGEFSDFCMAGLEEQHAEALEEEGD